ncbi:diacylglycerol kinase [Streptomyces sp. 8N616]|uniref:diacylglycerol kinase n=1 Tax=Streptomyces sp. 8N616 TaxID=3457414 RepID=UPI003FD24700
MSAPAPTEHQLLVVIDPTARRIDGEAVRIAKDVLCAGATAKICLPEDPEEMARALSRRGSRRPVVVGDDAALLRIVALLHRERALSASALALVPVGESATEVALARALGVPAGPVEAARAVLDGVDRKLDLLVDDSDGIVLGGLRIPAVPAARGGGGTGGRGRWWEPGLRTCRTLVRSLTATGPDSSPSVAGAPPGQSRGQEQRPGQRPGRGERGGHRLRVEADGVLLADLDQPVEAVSVTTAGAHSDDDGLARVVVQPSAEGGGGAPRTARARAVTVSGPDFRYHADTRVGGPVRTRTWTLQSAAWRLTLPRD